MKCVIYETFKTPAEQWSRALSGADSKRGQSLCQTLQICGSPKHADHTRAGTCPLNYPIKKTVLWREAQNDRTMIPSLRSCALSISPPSSLSFCFLLSARSPFIFFQMRIRDPQNSTLHPPCLQTTQLYGSTFFPVRMVSQIQFQIERI